MKGEDQNGPAPPPRLDWEAAFAEMHERGEDHLLDEPTPTRFDIEEWEW